MMTTKNEDLRGRLSAIQSLPASPLQKTYARWKAISSNILQDDLGEFNDSIKFEYEIDHTTRDRLIAHGRQDAAMANIVARDAFEQARAANIYAKLAAMFSFVTMCVLIFAVFKLL